MKQFRVGLVLAGALIIGGCTVTAQRVNLAVSPAWTPLPSDSFPGPDTMSADRDRFARHLGEATRAETLVALEQRREGRTLRSVSVALTLLTAYTQIQQIRSGNQNQVYPAGYISASLLMTLAARASAKARQRERCARFLHEMGGAFSSKWAATGTPPTSQAWREYREDQRTLTTAPVCR